MKRKPAIKKETAKKPVQEVASFENQISQPSRLKNFMVIVMAVFSFFLYANTLTHNYTVDDGTVMQNNKIVKKGIGAIPEIFTTRYRQGFWERKENLYRPLSLAMFAIEWQLAPEKPIIGHAVNVFLYMLTGVLLFLTLVKLLPQKNLVIPFITSLLFIAHPIHTEVIANIKSRDEILCLLFIIASVNSLITYINSSRFIAIVLSLVFFLLALLSKETAITFVAIVPLIIYFFTSVKIKKGIGVAACFAGLVGLYLLIRASVLDGLGNDTELQLVNNSLIAAPDFITRFASAMNVMGKYLFLLFIPHPLVFDYSYNQVQNVPISDIKSLLSISIYLALFIYAIKTFRKKNFKSFGILFFLVTISLVANIFFLIESTIAERFLYIPSLGFCLAVAVLLAEIFKADVLKKSAVTFSQLLKNNKPVFVLTFIILVLFSSKTISRNFNWKDNLTLLAHDVKLSPESARIRYAYGSAILIEQALKEKDATKKSTLLDKAIVQLEKGVEILDTYADAFYHLGLAYKEKEDYIKAVYNFEQARKHKTFTEADFFIGAGIAYYGAGKIDEAIADMKKAVEMSPESYDAYNNLGLYYNDINEFEKAIAAMQKAIAIKPDFEKAIYNIGNVYAKKGDYNKAIEFYNKAVVINPKYEDAYNNIGNSYAAMKDYEHAIKYFLKVMELNPNNQKVLNNIGVTYKILGDNVNGDKYLEMAKNVQAN
ncbi:MAG: tetratricopeptide repeat protein [Bacteroidia bacterium]